MTKKFTAIAAATYQNKLTTLAASNGNSITRPDGIDLDTALKFFFDLRYKKEKNEVFICYAFQTENEFLFSQLSDSTKDKLFQSHEVREKIDDLSSEIDELDYQLFNLDRESESYELFDFERYVNKLSLRDLTDVDYNGYNIRLINGKLLTVNNKKGKRFILYDVYGFFRKPLHKALQEWTGGNIPLLDRSKLELLEGVEIQQLAAYASFEAKHISKLMDALNNILIANNINLSRFNGVTTISSWLLSKSKAKEEFYNYKYRRQYTGGLYDAVTQAYYGGRVEQFKIGTFKQTVYVYDLNSAYAYASSLLPVMRSKPIFTNAWKKEIFSLWHCEYDFNSINPYFGLLPNRDVGSAIKYKVRGKGYFWQPEIQYIVENYPQCITIDHGFYIPYNKAKFTQAILDLYELRRDLQQRKHPLEKVIKLALSAIYGKFCQRDGYAYYYNLFYAGFITSMTRAKMLEAVKGYERNCICFLTDAIHSTINLPVTESDQIGEWKKTEYGKAQYLDAGVYRLFDASGNLSKEKTKGFRSFNFEQALTELQEFRTYTALAEFFVGHNLHTFMPMRFKDYLALQKENKKTNPFESNARTFQSLGIDLTETYCESSILDQYSGRESAAYKSKYNRESDAAKDSLMAEKI